MAITGKKLVVHCKREPHDVYIGRPGPWGNPFSHLEGSTAQFKVATREEAVKAYSDWFLRQTNLIHKAQKELRGKVLGCWCSPLACHGDILARVANEVCAVCKNPDAPHYCHGDQFLCSDCLGSCMD